jgi:hypothetical protein
VDPSLGVSVCLRGIVEEDKLEFDDVENRCDKRTCHVTSTAFERSCAFTAMAHRRLFLQRHDSEFDASYLERR